MRKKHKITGRRRSSWW